MRRPLSTLLLLAALAVVPGVSPRADVSLNNMFGDHMVLQQGIKNKVWGKASPGEAVTVTLGGQKHETKAGADGAWQVIARNELREAARQAARRSSTTFRWLGRGRRAGACSSCGGGIARLITT